MKRIVTLSELGNETCFSTVIECHRQIWEEKQQWNGYRQTPRFYDGLLLVVSPIRLSFFCGDGTQLTAGKGDVIYIPKGSRYVVSFENGGGDPDIYTVNFSLFDTEGNSLCLSDRICRCSTYISPECLYIAETLSREWISPRSGKLRMSARLFELLSCLGEETELSIAAHSQIREGIRRLNAEWRLDLPIEHYAEISGVSVSGFYRLFKEWAGISPNEYRTRMRISTAKSMLRQSNLSIGEIAARVGYADPYYFSRCFRRTVGVSPQQYRMNPEIP